MSKELIGKQKGWRRFSRLRVEKGAFKRRARKIESATLKHAHRFLVRRWTNVRDVGRHTIGWLILVGVLISLAFLQVSWFSDGYTTQAAAEGGIYAEGIVGRIDTMNPLFAKTPAEISASKLIFSGLLSYDHDNQLRPDVASSWSISEDGKVYTVNLKDNVYWHDGMKLTADDVLFTLKLIQNEAVRAVQYRDFSVVKVEKKSNTQVQFTLPSVYAPFANSLTFGILPAHLLRDVRPSDMRENNFGRKPIGTGPFMFKQIQLIDPDRDRVIIHMEANNKYYGGSVRLNRMQLRTYEDRAALKKALQTSEVNAVLGLGADQVYDMTKSSEFNASTSLLNDGMFALFNNDRQVFKDAQVRQALLLATNREKIISKIYKQGELLDGPLPASFLPGETARQASFDSKAAAAKLDAAGWKQEGAERKKDGQRLELSLIAPDSGDYKLIVDELATEWRALGIVVNTQLIDPASIVTDYLQPRNYDILVYELAIGADPDVYPYWHSSQASAKGLNFANYRSGLEDDVLSGARGKLDKTLRLVKYKTFYEQWLKDTPAIALYQPYLSYTTTSNSFSLEEGSPLADIFVRYRNVQDWAITQSTVMTTR